VGEPEATPISLSTQSPHVATDYTSMLTDLRDWHFYIAVIGVDRSSVSKIRLILSDSVYPCPKTAVDPLRDSVLPHHRSTRKKNQQEILEVTEYTYAW